MTLQQSAPIIVHVVQQPVESTTVADVLLGSIGLAGVLLLAALVLGMLLGAVLIGFKTWRNRNAVDGLNDSDTIHIVEGY
jgi:hypothetical protein